MELSFIFDNAQYIPLVIIGIGVLIGFFGGLARGLAKTALHLVMLCIRAVAAVILTKVLIPVLVPPLIKAISGLITNPDVVELLENPEFTELAKAIVGVFFGTTVFIAFFIAVAIIIKPIEWLIASAMSKENGMRLFGGMLGMITGCLLISVLMLPSFGMLHISATSLKDVDFKENEKYKTLIEDMDDSDTLRIYRLVGGEPLFNYLSTADYMGNTVCLDEESYVVSDIAKEAMNISDNPDVSTWSDKEINSVRKVAERMSDSNILPQFIKSSIKCIDDAWKKGEDFVGIEKPDMPESIEPTVMLMLDTFAGSTTDNIGNSIITFADVIGILNESGILSDVVSGGNMDAKELASGLSKNGTVDKIVDRLNKDENLKVLVPEITNITLRLIAQMTELPEGSDEEISEVMNEFADVYNESLAGKTEEEQVSAISAGIEKISKENGLEVPDFEREEIAKRFVEAFGDKETITGEEMNEWFRSFLESQTLPEA